MSPLRSFLLTYLINSIWEVPLLFFITKGIARLAAKCGLAMQHRIWVASLILQTILPASSSSSISSALSLLQSVRFSKDVPPSVFHITALSGEGSLHGTLALPSPLLLSLALLYLCILLYFVTAFAQNLWRVYRLRWSALPLTLTESAQARWTLYRDRFHIPEATLAASPGLCGPVTVGIRNRLMLLPPTFETLLNAEDQAVAFAHEFAHMQRMDFAKNLLYQTFALPIAYHPALRGTLAHIAETREILCDALAAQAVEGPRRYARSLLRLASIFTPPTPTLHAIGIFDANPNTLETRIMKLTSPSRSLGRLSRVAVGALSAALLLVTYASASALRVEVGGPAKSTTSDVAAKSPRVSSAVMEGNILKKVPPVYPPEAKKAKITGAVVLKAIIGKEGTVEQLTLISGPGELAPSALDAVRQWLYKPYLLNGNPTEVETTITINYSLSE